MPPWGGWLLIVCSLLFIIVYAAPSDAYIEE